jgi:hypothetical protein
MACFTTMSTNCTADAFQTAAHTLRARIEQFGVDSVDVLDWVRAQDQVFGNCSGTRAIPLPPHRKAGDSPEGSRYQIAAAHFMPAIWRSPSACFVTLRMIRRPTGDHWPHISSPGLYCARVA